LAPEEHCGCTPSSSSPNLASPTTTTTTTTTVMIDGTATVTQITRFPANGGNDPKTKCVSLDSSLGCYTGMTDMTGAANLLATTVNAASDSFRLLGAVTVVGLRWATDIEAGASGMAPCRYD
jgi:hypothetical protein